MSIVPDGDTNADNPLTDEIEHALRVLGVTSRAQGANVLNAVPLALTDREREAVLRRLDEPEQQDHNDRNDLGNPESGKILRPLGPGLSGPGGPAGDVS